MLYLHGGAYILGSAETHRNLASYLAQAAQCVVYARITNWRRSIRIR